MKFTSEILRKAWKLAREVGQGNARRFFGWALKEVRTVSEEIDLTKYPRRIARAVPVRAQMEDISIAEALKAELAFQAELEGFTDVAAYEQHVLAQKAATPVPAAPVWDGRAPSPGLDGTF